MSGSKEAKNQSADSSDEKVATVNSLDGVEIENTLSERKEVLPEDALTETDDYNVAVQKRQTLEKDDILAKQVAHYLSREQRNKLDQQIEELYNRVAHELSDNPKDVVFALEKLKKAQEIVMVDMRQYEEALYWVAQVKRMLNTKHKLRRWSYSWGLFVFFYALIWLIAFIAGFFVDVATLGINTVGWFSALAGGIGGVVIILTSLSWQVSIRQSFDRQHLMKYLVQPIMGFILGAVIFFIISTGFLAVSTADNFAGTGLVIFQILLGFIAGLSQEVVYKTVEYIIPRLSPKTDKPDNSTESKQKEDIEALETAREPAS